jgi:hypothetical protein
MCLNLCYTLATLAGTSCRHLVLTYVAPLHKGNSSSLPCHHYTTNMVGSVVQRSNHCAVLSSATTSLDLPVPVPRHGSLPAVPRLAPFGPAPCTVPRPKGPVYHHGGCWPFVYIMPQDVTVYRHAGCSSLMSWGTFRATWSVLGQDILIAAALASLAHESHELIRNVSYHGQTSAGHAHHCSVSS